MLFVCKNQQATKQLAQQLAHCCPLKIVIYLEGDLGAGKTTLARGFIQVFGFDKVKSPTYSLVESYENANICIHHFDYYRLNDPEELDYIGVREYQGVQLIEWAGRASNMIVAADMVISLSGQDKVRQIDLKAHTKIGAELLACIKKTNLKNSENCAKNTLKI